MSLEPYNEKRDFSQTPEPAGEVKKTSSTLSFVIQKHDASHLHYDFRLEVDGVLKSWAVPKGPSLRPLEKRLAMMVEDHPLDYASFEGIIPEGNYGAGEVIVWDNGTYYPKGYTPEKDIQKIVRSGIQKGSLKLIMVGKKIKGEYSLVKIKNDKDNEWLLIKKQDLYATDEDITGKEQSVISNRTLDDLKKQPEKIKLPPSLKKELPEKIAPMMAVLGKEAFDSNNHIFEVKWDGYRAIAHKNGEMIRFYSRSGLSFHEKYPSIVNALKKLSLDAVFDGEVMVVDEEGRPHFQWLQDYGKQPKGTLVYYIFDILSFQGYDLTSLPLERRKQILASIPLEVTQLRLSQHIEERGKAFFEAAKQTGLEGIIAKRRDSPYRIGKRSDDWIKIKRVARQEAIICGFTKPRGGRKRMGAVILGVYDKGQLRYIGHTGGGFTQASLNDVWEKLQPLVQSTCPFAVAPKTNEEPTWVSPMLVCEIEFREWTHDRHVRQPIFVGLREDKQPEDVVIETAQEATPLKKAQTETKKKSLLSHPNKLYWPKEGITKKMLYEYYERVAPLLLPYLVDRPQSLHRFPNGIEEDGFFQKDVAGQVPPWIQTHTVRSESEERDVTYLVCQNTDTLLYIVNLGCIEINPWNSRVETIHKPDYLVIDLDPEDITFEKVVEAATTTKEVLDILSLPSYCKTSGATGLHIYIPLGAKYSYDQTKTFAELLVTLVHQKIPAFTSIERSPAKRQKKVYLDYLQNRFGQTLAAPYSVRPRANAPVSTPLLWSEVIPSLNPSDFTIHTIHSRIKKYGDLWKPVREEGINLEKALNNIQKLFAS